MQAAKPIDIETLARWRWGDLLLVLLLAFVCLYGLDLLHARTVRAEQRPGHTARVFINGTLQEEIALNRVKNWSFLNDRVELAVGPDGVRVGRTDCPAQICRDMGAIRFPGYQIICLPHRLLVEIAPRTDESGDYPVDAVTR